MGLGGAIWPPVADAECTTVLHPFTVGVLDIPPRKAWLDMLADIVPAGVPGDCKTEFVDCRTYWRAADLSPGCRVRDRNVAVSKAGCFLDGKVDDIGIGNIGTIGGPGGTAETSPRSVTSPSPANCNIGTDDGRAS